MYQQKALINFYKIYLELDLTKSQPFTGSTDFHLSYTHQHSLVVILTQLYITLKNNKTKEKKIDISKHDKKMGIKLYNCY